MGRCVRRRKGNEEIDRKKVYVGCERVSGFFGVGLIYKRVMEYMS